MEDLHQDRRGIMPAKVPLKAAVCAIAFALAQTIATTAHSGTTCDDCSTNKGAFSLENGSRVPIEYQVKWGDGAWVSHTLKVGHTDTHSHPAKGDGVPS